MGRLTEEFVRNRVLEWLSKQGYGYFSRIRTLQEHGEDIKARRTGSNNYFIIEVKGEPESNPVKMRHPTLVSALGELVQRVKAQRHFRYAIALPETYRELVLRRMPWAAAKKIGFEFLLVSEEGKVSRLTWRDLQSMATHKKGTDRDQLA